MTVWLLHEGHAVNRKRVQRLMPLMGLEAISPKPRLSLATQGHRKFPYLLRGLSVNRVNQVWATDITYVPMPREVHVPGGCALTTSGSPSFANAVQNESRLGIAFKVAIIAPRDEPCEIRHRLAKGSSRGAMMATLA